MHSTNYCFSFQDFQSFLDKHHDGVILFSLGSTGFHKDFFPVPFANTLIKTFRILGKGVIMRIDPEHLEKIVKEPIPENILVAGSIPQLDLIGKND